MHHRLNTQYFLSITRSVFEHNQFSKRHKCMRREKAEVCCDSVNRRLLPISSQQCCSHNLLLPRFHWLNFWNTLRSLSRILYTLQSVRQRFDDIKPNFISSYGFAFRYGTLELDRPSWLDRLISWYFYAANQWFSSDDTSMRNYSLVPAPFDCTNRPKTTHYIVLEAPKNKFIWLTFLVTWWGLSYHGLNSPWHEVKVDGVTVEALKGRIRPNNHI